LNRSNRFLLALEAWPSLDQLAALYLESSDCWIGTEVRIFCVLSEPVAIACFLGFGVGLYKDGKLAGVPRRITARVVVNSFSVWHGANSNVLPLSFCRMQRCGCNLKLTGRALD